MPSDLSSSVDSASVANAPHSVQGSPLEHPPKHIAIIMDGNGRWATQRGLPRTAGHRAGTEAVRRTLKTCKAFGIKTLTLYSFSTENWSRPAEEVDALMSLLQEMLTTELDTLIAEKTQLRILGQREGMPAAVLAALDAAVAATAPAPEAEDSAAAFTLCLALNYGGRAELVEAARSLAKKAAAGTIDPESIDEAQLERCLTTAGLPDPDLLIRTAGEQRISNFLLWQCSYAELYFTKTLWPDFAESNLRAALDDYASRQRRFGDVQPASHSD